MSKRVALRPEHPEGHRVGRHRGMDVYLDGDLGEDYICVTLYGNKVGGSGRRQVISKLSLSTEYCDNAYHVDLMEVDHRFQGHGIAPLLYRYLIRKLGIILQAGTAQSVGGRKIWAQLAKMKDITVFAAYPRGGRRQAFMIDLDKEAEELEHDSVELYDGRKVYTFAASA